MYDIDDLMADVVAERPNLGTVTSIKLFRALSFRFHSILGRG